MRFNDKGHKGLPANARTVETGGPPEGQRDSGAPGTSRGKNGKGDPSHARSVTAPKRPPRPHTPDVMQGCIGRGVPPPPCTEWLCCVYVTLTRPEPTGVFNLRTKAYVPRSTGQTGPTASRYTTGLTSDRYVRHSPGRVWTATTVSTVWSKACVHMEGRQMDTGGSTRLSPSTNPGFPRNPSLAPLPLLSTVCSIFSARSRPSDGCSTYTVPVS